MENTMRILEELYTETLLEQLNNNNINVKVEIKDLDTEDCLIKIYVNDKNNNLFYSSEIKLDHNFTFTYDDCVETIKELLK